MLLWRRDFSAPIALPGGAEIEVLRYGWEAVGGPSWAALVVTGAPDAVGEALEWLRGGVEVFNPQGICTWWGYVRSVRIDLGALAVGVTLEGMANRVAVRYLARLPGDVPEYRVVQTAWAEDAGSVAEFGAKEVLLQLGSGTSAAQAAAAREALLATAGRPLAVVSAAGGALAITRATVWCRGWLDTLDWQYYSQPAGLEEQAVANARQDLGLGLTAEDIGFIQRTGAVSDMAAALGEFEVDDRLVIEDAPANNGVYTVWAGTRQPAWSYTAATLSFDSAGGGLWEVRDSAQRAGLAEQKRLGAGEWVAE